jgi:hypothetical protein
VRSAKSYHDLLVARGFAHRQILIAARKFPKPKLQIPSKFQFPRIQKDNHLWDVRCAMEDFIALLELLFVWNLLGIWGLGFGISGVHVGLGFGISLCGLNADLRFAIPFWI